MDHNSDDGFTLVTKNSRRSAAKRRKNADKTIGILMHGRIDTQMTTEEIIQMIERCISDMKGSAWFGEVKMILRKHVEAVTANVQSIEFDAGATNMGSKEQFGKDDVAHADGDQEGLKITRMICYGIGNFSSSASSLLQISLARLLKESFQIVSSSLFDPVMTEAERAAAQSLGFIIPEEDEVGLCATNSDSLFFMPHCGRRLYSNVLRANWGPRNLARIVIMGNSFGAYRMRRLPDNCKDSCCIEKLGEDVVSETALPKHAEENSFIDTSVHSFPLQVIEV
eukprot:757137-Hanusia_phi.AAC.4